MIKKCLPLLVGVLMLVGLFGQRGTPAQGHGDHALLRLAHFVADGPTVDVYVNDAVAMGDVEAASITDFMEVEPGTYSISAAPAGESMETAIIAPMDITVEAGHRYSVVVMGQAADNSISSQLLDETQIVSEFDMTQGSVIIMANNIAGGPAVTYYDDAIVHSENVGYGEIKMSFVPAENWDTGMATVADDPETVVFDFDSEVDGLGGFWEPYTVYLFGMVGTYPGAMFEDYGLVDSHYTIAANAVELLQAFSGLGLTFDTNGEIVYEFDMLLAAIEAAGLGEMLMGEGPYTIFAPTNYAISQLPEGTIEAWMADPEQLATVLQNHVVMGDMTRDILLSGEPITTVAGGTLTFTEDAENFVLVANGSVNVQDFDYPVGNGRVWFVDNMVLVPAME